MKFKKCLFGATIALGLAIGAGATALCLKAPTKASAAAVNGTVDLSTGVYNANGDGTGAATITWSGVYWTVVQHKGYSTSAVNNSYISAPRLYKGHYLSFEAPDGVTFNSITITSPTSNYGSDLTYFASATSGAATPAGDGTAVPTNGITLTAAASLVTPDLASAKSVFIQNSYNSAPKGYKQLRPTAIQINYTSSIVVVDPTSVSVSLASSTLTELGTTTQATETVLPATATDKSVTWSSSNEEVAVVDANGLVTALSNGTADITATSKAVTALSGKATVTVNAAASTVYDKAISDTIWGGPTGGYGTGTYYWVKDGVSYASTSCGIMAGKTEIQFNSPDGILTNTSAYAADIKKITVTLSASGTLAASFNVGATASAITTALTPTVTGAVNVFTPDAGNKFFKISAPTATVKVKSIVIELVATDVEAARTYAASFLSTIASECTSLAVQSGTWSTLTSNYSSLSDAAKLAFKNEAYSSLAVTDIENAVAKYDYIVAKYGYANFMSRATGSGAVVLGGESPKNNTALIITMSVAVVLLGFGAVLLLRKKKMA